LRSLGIVASSIHTSYEPPSFSLPIKRPAASSAVGNADIDRGHAAYFLATSLAFEQPEMAENQATYP